MYRSLAKLIAMTLIAIAISGCASLDRLPAVSLASSREVRPLDIPDARFYEDDVQGMRDLVKRLLAKEARSTTPTAGEGTTRPRHYLAISGGGDDGAFGAGLLVGWSEKGTRPRFDIVTGISTGAMSAPFVFLGSEYDSQLREVFTQTDAGEVFRRRTVLAAIANDAMADTAPLRNMIAGYLNPGMVARIGQEYEKGRLLLIMTTNLDQGRSVIWNIGAIAVSAHPRARDLIVDILLASASIPGAFPPVMLDVPVNGEMHQEMHVDGGATAQMFLYPPSIRVKQSLLHSRARFAYVIRNGRLFRPEESINRQTLSIAASAISTMTASSGRNDTYKIYLTTKRDNVAFNLAFIDDDFSERYRGPFDTNYMRSLFDYGYQRGLKGISWRKAPPGFQE